MAFELFQNEKTKKFYFRLQSKNKKTVLQSQGYTDKRSAKAGIKAVIKSSASDGFEKKVAKNGSHYFVLRSSNGKQVGKSQMYTTSAGASNGMRSVRNNAINEIVEILFKTIMQYF